MLKLNLRVMMAERKLSNKELIAMSGVSSATISRLKMLDEIQNISGHVIYKLCRALDCTPNDLLTLVDTDDEGCP